MTMKVLTIRIPHKSYSSLCKEAGAAGITVSAHARRLIEKEQDTDFLTRLRNELFEKIDVVIPASTIKPQFEMTEILLLLRELAADRNPQILQRVRAKINQFQDQKEN